MDVIEQARRQGFELDERVASDAWVFHTEREALSWMDDRLRRALIGELEQQVEQRGLLAGHVLPLDADANTTTCALSHVAGDRCELDSIRQEVSCRPKRDVDPSTIERRRSEEFERSPT
jgi:hypothetical protein